MIMRRKNIMIISAVFIVVVLTAVFAANVYSNMVQSKREHTITVLSGHEGTREYFLGSMKKAYPEYDYDYIEVDWGNDFAYKMQEMIQSKNVPDIIIGKTQDIYAYQPLGIIAPFDEDMFTDKNLKAADYSINGSLYCLPYDAIYQGVLYNKDIFDVYSLQVPSTKQELKAITDRLGYLGITPFAANYADDWQIANNLMQLELNNIFNTEPNWGADFNNNIVSFSDSPEMYSCADDIAYISKNSWKDCLDTADDEAYSRFYNGEAAMYLSGTWFFKGYNEHNDDINIGIFPYPNENGNSELIFESDTAFMKSASTIHKDVVDDIIRNLINDETLAQNIADITESLSLVHDVHNNYPQTLLDDIEMYSREGKLIDAAVGNSQLIWNFQLAQAAATSKYINGECSLEDVMQQNDENQFINKGNDK